MSAIIQEEEDFDLKDVAGLSDPAKPSIGWKGSDLKALLGESFVDQAEDFVDHEGMLWEFDWSPKGRKTPKAVFEGQALTVRLSLNEADSQKLQRPQCETMTREIAAKLHALVPEANQSIVKVFSLSPSYDRPNDRWNFELVIAESEEDDIDFKDVFEEDVPPAFALPQNASTEAVKAWEIVIGVLRALDGLDARGAKHVFYTPDQWAYKTNGNQSGAVLVVAHDGGDHEAFFNLDAHAYALHATMDLALRRAGFYLQRGAGWYSLIYKAQHDTSADVQALENYLQSVQDRPLAPDQQRLVDQARRDAADVEESEEDDFDMKELDEPAEKWARVRQLLQRAGLRISYTIEAPKDDAWGDLGHPQRIIVTFLEPNANKPWTSNPVGTGDLINFCRQIKSYLFEIVDTDHVDFVSNWDDKVGAWELTWFVGDPTITQERRVNEDLEDDEEEDDFDFKDVANDQPSDLVAKAAELLKEMGCFNIKGYPGDGKLVVTCLLTANGQHRPQRSVAYALRDRLQARVVDFKDEWKPSRHPNRLPRIKWVFDVYTDIVEGQEEDFRPRPCVNCGYCCKKAPCPYGEWDPVNKRCKQLTPDNKCGIHDEIAGDTVAPAFGTGCCSPMNSDRLAIVRQRRGLPPRQESEEEEDFDFKDATEPDHVPEVEVKDSFDGDTMSYEVIVDGETKLWAWSTNEAIEWVAKHGYQWKNGQVPRLSHIPEEGSPLWPMYLEQRRLRQESEEEDDFDMKDLDLGTDKQDQVRTALGNVGVSHVKVFPRQSGPTVYSGFWHRGKTQNEAFELLRKVCNDLRVPYKDWSFIEWSYDKGTGQIAIHLDDTSVGHAEVAESLLSTTVDTVNTATRLVEAGAVVKSVQETDRQGFVEIKGEWEAGKTVEALVEAFALDKDSTKYDARTGEFSTVCNEQATLVEDETEDDFDFKEATLPEAPVEMAKAVDVSDRIWKDDNKLRKAFSWLTRIGAAPKFGGMPIAYYQEEQIKALDKIKLFADLKRINVEWVRYRNGHILAWDADKNKWVAIARLFYDQMLPESLDDEDDFDMKDLDVDKSIEAELKRRGFRPDESDYPNKGYRQRFVKSYMFSDSDGWITIMVAPRRDTIPVYISNENQSVLECFFIRGDDLGLIDRFDDWFSRTEAYGKAVAGIDQIRGRRKAGDPLDESVADDVAAAAAKADKDPSDAEKEAENYRKGHVRLHGLEIAIENAKGSTRSGKDKDGKEWSVTMPAVYGYFKGTQGKDKDHIDCYIGPDPDCELVFVVNQQKKEGGFDEHKVMLGFKTEKEALETYDAAFTGDLGPKLRKSVVSGSVDQLKHWLENGDTMKEVVALQEGVTGWHASPNKFRKFDTSREGSHFGTPEQANNVRKPGLRPAKPYRLAIENPLRIRDLGTWTVDGIATELHTTGLIDDAEADAVYAERNWSDERGYEKIKQILTAKGYDGLVYANEQEGQGDSHIAFYSKQIKPIKESEDEDDFDFKDVTAPDAPRELTWVYKVDGTYAEGQQRRVLVQVYAPTAEEADVRLQALMAENGYYHISVLAKEQGKPLVAESDEDDFDMKDLEPDRPSMAWEEVPLNQAGDPQAPVGGKYYTLRVEDKVNDFVGGAVIETLPKEGTDLLFMLGMIHVEPTGPWKPGETQWRRWDMPAAWMPDFKQAVEDLFGAPMAIWIQMVHANGTKPERALRSLWDKLIKGFSAESRVVEARADEAVRSLLEDEDEDDFDMKDLEERPNFSWKEVPLNQVGNPDSDPEWRYCTLAMDDRAHGFKGSALIEVVPKEGTDLFYASGSISVQLDGRDEARTPWRNWDMPIASLPDFKNAVEEMFAVPIVAWVQMMQTDPARASSSLWHLWGKLVKAFDVRSRAIIETNHTEEALKALLEDDDEEDEDDFDLKDVAGERDAQGEWSVVPFHADPQVAEDNPVDKVYTFKLKDDFNHYEAIAKIQVVKWDYRYLPAASAYCRLQLSNESAQPPWPNRYTTQTEWKGFDLKAPVESLQAAVEHFVRDGIPAIIQRRTNDASRNSTLDAKKSILTSFKAHWSSMLLDFSASQYGRHE